MESSDKLLCHYNYIRRLAESRCSSVQDAEDLISETFLAAYTYISDGGAIEYPKTWLANTLIHKYNSMLRKKYSTPAMVDLSAAENFPSEEDEVFAFSEEAEKVRAEILYLSRITRDVIIRYYYNGYSVADIARQLGIPQGTVKSRLSAGREKIKKGFMAMNETKNNIPGRLYVSTSGRQGPRMEPVCYVADDLIAQNLLVLAYDKPLTILELAKAIGIPTVYIEPIVRKLTDAELMAKTDGGKYYTDFIIYKPEDDLRKFNAQKEFTEKRFDRFWKIISDEVSRLHSLDFVMKMNSRQQTKLERYVILKALQRFQIKLSDEKSDEYPKRRDGGAWTASGYYYPYGHDDDEAKEKNIYVVNGGHRSEGGPCDYKGACFLQLLEFDTTLWDNPCRHGVCGTEVYFNEIRKLLWCIYRDIPIEESGISNTMIESVPSLIKETGLIVREDGKLKVDIPTVTRSEFKEIEAIVSKCFEELKDELGEEYIAYLHGNMMAIPKHLKGIKDMYRYLPSTTYILMMIVREAYEKGLHLAGVDYCCPPVVFVYDK